MVDRLHPQNQHHPSPCVTILLGDRQLRTPHYRDRPALDAYLATYEPYATDLSSTEHRNYRHRFVVAAAKWVGHD
jgi:hypothetical protein